MDSLVIQGRSKLHGDVEISGAKNSALPILIACLMIRKPVILTNVPHLKDVTTTLHLLSSMGVDILFDERLNIEIDSLNVESKEVSYKLVKTMRASILVLGPLLAHFGKAKVALPGGCAIGSRPVNIHIDGMKQMGATINIEDGCIVAYCNKKLHGADISMEVTSVTGTENLMMAAVLAEGKTILRNSAKEPEVTDLANFLNSVGAKITGQGTNTIEIEGVEKLHGGSYTVIPDRIEAGTYLAAAAVTKGKVTVRNVIPKHLSIVLKKFIEAGANISSGKDWITLDMVGRELKPVDITTKTYPGFPTDMQAQFMVMNALAQGKSEITENIFENRFMHISELNRMGANIVENSNIAKIQGVKNFNKNSVTATDLRASACLILAGLSAKGKTTINHIYHIDRGYELIEEKFYRLGANIKRVTG